MAEPVEISGNLGDTDHAALIQSSAKKFVLRSAKLVRVNVKNFIHHITGETYRSLEIETADRPPYYFDGEVVTRVPWGTKLEFHQAPFLRPATWYSRRYIRKEFKQIFGPEYRASIRTKSPKRRRR